MNKNNKRRFRHPVMLGAAVLGLGALVGPLLVRVPPLEGTHPPEELADPDSLFADLNGVRVHYKMAGSGSPLFVLLHGFGASLFSWHKVMQPLAGMGTVVALDRPAFGLTERPTTWVGQNPYSPEAQVEMTIALIDRLGYDKAVLVGNSAGGAIAMLAALRRPERIEALVLADASIYRGGGAPREMQPILRSPQMRRLGPLLLRQIGSRGMGVIRAAWHDPSRITAETIEGYRKPLQADNWDYALWEFTLASGSLGLPARLGEIDVPTLIITGDDDRIVPTKQSVRLASEIKGAELSIIENCGHVPQEECPQEFIEAVRRFISNSPKIPR